MIKSLEEGKKALIFCQNDDDFKAIDAGLWTFGKFRFIPHVTIHETDIEKLSTWSRQPVVITNELENKNEAHYLVLTHECDLNFVKKFARIFYFYDSTKLDQAKKFAKTLGDDFAVKSYKKVKAKWEGFEF